MRSVGHTGVPVGVAIAWTLKVVSAASMPSTPALRRHPFEKRPEFRAEIVDISSHVHSSLFSLKSPRRAVPG